MSLLTEAHALAPDLTALRHALHREPELGLDLPRTQAKVLTALEGLGLEITLGTALSSVTAVLRGGLPGPAVLLRGDMDALPVQEETGLPYASVLDGRMHACGHDLHVTGLVGAARLLAARRAELAGDVVFMFQPGEEGQGGAKIMIDEGVLDAAGDRVVAAYALHVVSTGAPTGFAATRPGPMLAASDAVEVTVHGRGGHGSSPHSASDPVPAMCAMVTALQTLVTREIDIFDPAVVTVGRLHAGTAANVIPGTAHFEATVRTFSDAAHATVRAAFERTVHGVAAAHGVRAEIDYVEQYPPTVNHPAEAAFALTTARELMGAGQVLEAPKPMAGAEDFSFVLREVPGAYVGVGACPPGTDPATAPMNHSPRAVYDDGALPYAAALLAGLAQRRLDAAAATPTTPASTTTDEEPVRP
ncbi:MULTISPECIES: M20 family metallopeptidase [Streptomyces]|uniref:M20 metallopeptidase family protein n=1 Tax=Streptomyces TaxID=1883 RepID=UPI000D50FD02|nr:MULTISPECIES: M20 family metallopeptidase [Streptomyces]MXG26009.1 amidohydrolase [Streptomyces sp. YIM 132580]PVC64077.1 amidohydrolase [Streptomyces sp. CS065A]